MSRPGHAPAPTGGTLFESFLYVRHNRKGRNKAAGFSAGLIDDVDYPAASAPLFAPADHCQYHGPQPPHIPQFMEASSFISAASTFSWASFCCKASFWYR